MYRQIHSGALALTAFVSLLCAQSPKSPANSSPVQVKRVPAGQTPPSKQTQTDPVIQNYDFGGQFRVLQDPTAMDPSKAAGPSGGAPETDGKAPKGFQPRTDVPLNPTALEAVRMSETWRGGQNVPAAGPDGRVLFAYGAGLPIVVCAPLRVCMIELQSGERITGEPQIGDSVRWNISPAMYGQGEQTTSVIILKPQEPGLDTNLLITTDRRAYYLRLVSKPQDYVARVAFSYPEEDNSQKWQQHVLEQRALAQENNRKAQLTPAMITADKLNFNYKVSGANEELRPVRVFDDGSKTYIQMRSDVQNREAPVLVVMGSDGKGEMTNYRVQQQTYIVDRLFDRAQLILGAGKKAQKVEISREQRTKG
ncbi:MAG TPA: P-type conjugative transfer protein TrbG [Bryobacteraceae bacterium]|nr:P-type conjugative transfer protein TrbG [Bryobacteraceae bacterium]